SLRAGGRRRIGGGGGGRHRGRCRRDAGDGRVGGPEVVHVGATAGHGGKLDAGHVAHGGGGRDGEGELLAHRDDHAVRVSATVAVVHAGDVDPARGLGPGGRLQRGGLFDHRARRPCKVQVGIILHRNGHVIHGPIVLA